MERIKQELNIRNILIGVMLVLVGFIIGVAGTLIIVIRAGHSLF